MENNTWLLLFISIALGLLVGLQRQSVNSKTAGIRTFPLITLSGTFSGLLSQVYGGWIIAAGFLGIAAIMVMTNINRAKTDEDPGGMTTEIAVLLMFLVGCYLVIGMTGVAVVATGVVTVLLHFKTVIHSWVDKFGEKDLVAVMQFVLITMVILPVLPDRTFDLYESLNPRDIWMMVVLIVGISLTGYFLYKVFGSRAGTTLSGILGGIISSTATTMSYSKIAGRSPNAGKLAAYVIVTASAVSLVRVLVEIFVVAPTSFSIFLIPLGIELAVMIGLMLILFIQQQKDHAKMPEQSNPAQLKSAIIFALLYGGISFLSAFARDKFGNDALYVVSVISGLTDLDAITLSTSRMTEQKSIEASLGWRLILVATMSNLVFKGILAITIGNRDLAKRIIFYFGILIAAGLAILFLWPY